MSSKGSTLFTVGTLLRHAQDAGAPVRLLVQGTWLDGRIVGADGLGVILDDGNAQQVLVRLDSIVAVRFSRADIDDDSGEDARAQPMIRALSHRGPDGVRVEAAAGAALAHARLSIIDLDCGWQPLHGPDGARMVWTSGTIGLLGFPRLGECLTQIKRQGSRAY